jgi:C-terminal processing protease CtpA/Prc
MSKEIKIILICLSIALTMGLCFQAGFYLGLEQEDTTQTEDPYLASIEEAWNKISTYYVLKDSLDYELLSQYAIEGMLEYLDDNHSAYLNPKPMPRMPKTPRKLQRYRCGGLCCRRKICNCQGI